MNLIELRRVSRADRSRLGNSGFLWSEAAVCAAHARAHTGYDAGPRDGRTEGGHAGGRQRSAGKGSFGRGVESYWAVLRRCLAEIFITRR